MSKRHKFIIALSLLLICFLQHPSSAIEKNVNIDELIIKALNSDRDVSDNAKIKLLELGERALPDLLIAYKSGDYSERKAIGNLLIKYGSAAVPYLEIALLGEDDDLASNSAIILGEIGAESISSLEKVFKEKNFEYSLERNMEAAYALGRIGPEAYPTMIKLISGEDGPDQGTILMRDALIQEDKRATEYLITALKDTDPVRRYLAAVILGEYRDPLSLQALIEALNDQDKAVCTQVVVAISRFGNKAKVAAPFIIKRLNEVEEEKYFKVSDTLKGEIYVNFIREAIYTLKKIDADSEDVIPILIGFMRHNDSMIRSAATDVVGNYKKENSEVIETLKQASSDIKGEVRQKSIESFNRSDVEDEEIIRLVLLKLNDSYPSVRGAAVKTLGKFKENSDLIIPRLIAALNDENNYVRSQAAKSLGEFRESAINSIPKLIEATKDKDHDVRLEAINALGNIRMSSKEVLAALKLSFITEDTEIREQSANALQKFGISSVPSFIETLNHKEEIVRKISANKLGNINPKPISAVPNLIESLNDNSSIVVEASVASLGNIGPGARSSVPDLIMLTNHESDKIRKAAINALGNIGPDAAPDSIPVLIDLINGKDYELRRLSVIALGKFGLLSKPAVS